MLVKWSPFVEMSRIEKEMKDLWGSCGFDATPPVDVYEDEKYITIEVEIPGVDPNEVDITMDNGNLILKGERKARNSKNLAYLKAERAVGSFVRSFSLPKYIDADSIKAEYANGLLQISIKKTSTVNSKKIKVSLPS